MAESELLAGALSLVLRHDLTGCALSAQQAAAVLARIAEHPDIDRETRALCEEASLRLIDSPTETRQCHPNRH